MHREHNFYLYPQAPTGTLWLKYFVENQFSMAEYFLNVITIINAFQQIEPNRILNRAVCLEIIQRLSLCMHFVSVHSLVADTEKKWRDEAIL